MVNFESARKKKKRSTNVFKHSHLSNHTVRNNLPQIGEQGNSEVTKGIKNVKKIKLYSYHYLHNNCL